MEHESDSTSHWEETLKEVVANFLLTSAESAEIRSHKVLTILHDKDKQIDYLQKVISDLSRGPQTSHTKRYHDAAVQKLESATSAFQIPVLSADDASILEVSSSGGQRDPNYPHSASARREKHLARIRHTQSAAHRILPSSSTPVPAPRHTQTKVTQDRRGRDSRRSQQVEQRWVNIDGFGDRREPESKCRGTEGNFSGHFVSDQSHGDGNQRPVASDVMEKYEVNSGSSDSRRSDGTSADDRKTYAKIYDEIQNETGTFSVHGSRWNGSASTIFSENLTDSDEMPMFRAHSVENGVTLHAVADKETTPYCSRVNQIPDRRSVSVACKDVRQTQILPDHRVKHFKVTGSNENIDEQHGFSNRAVTKSDTIPNNTKSNCRTAEDLEWEMEVNAFFDFHAPTKEHTDPDIKAPDTVSNNSYIQDNTYERVGLSTDSFRNHQNIKNTIDSIYEHNYTERSSQIMSVPSKPQLDEDISHQNGREYEILELKDELTYRDCQLTVNAILPSTEKPIKSSNNLIRHQKYPSTNQEAMGASDHNTQFDQQNELMTLENLDQVCSETKKMTTPLLARLKSQIAVLAGLAEKYKPAETVQNAPQCRHVGILPSDGSSIPPLNLPLSAGTASECEDGTDFPPLRNSQQEVTDNFMTSQRNTLVHSQLSNSSLGEETKLTSNQQDYNTFVFLPENYKTACLDLKATDTSNVYQEMKIISVTDMTGNVDFNDARRETHGNLPFPSYSARTSQISPGQCSGRLSDNDVAANTPQGLRGVIDHLLHYNHQLKTATSKLEAEACVTKNSYLIELQKLHTYVQEIENVTPVPVHSTASQTLPSAVSCNVGVQTGDEGAENRQREVCTVGVQTGVEGAQNRQREVCTVGVQTGVEGAENRQREAGTNTRVSDIMRNVCCQTENEYNNPTQVAVDESNWKQIGVPKPKAVVTSDQRCLNINNVLDSVMHLKHNCLKAIVTERETNVDGSQVVGLHSAELNNLSKGIIAFVNKETESEITEKTLENNCQSMRTEVCRVSKSTQVDTMLSSQSKDETISNQEKLISFLTLKLEKSNKERERLVESFRETLESERQKQHRVQRNLEEKVMRFCNVVVDTYGPDVVPDDMFGEGKAGGQNDERDASETSSTATEDASVASLEAVDAGKIRRLLKTVNGSTRINECLMRNYSKTMKKKIQLLRAKHLEATNRITDFEHLLELNSATRSDLEDLVVQLRTEVERLAQENRRLQDALDENVATLSEKLGKQFRNAATHNLQARLHDANQQTVVRHRLAVDLKKEVEEAQKELQSVRGRLCRSETSNQNKQMIIEHCKKRIQDMENTLTITENQNKCLSKEVQAMKNAANVMKKQIAHLQGTDVEKGRSREKRLDEGREKTSQGWERDEESLAQHVATQCEQLRASCLSRVEVAEKRMRRAEKGNEEFVKALRSVLSHLHDHCTPRRAPRFDRDATSLSRSSEGRALACSILNLTQGQLQTMVQGSCRTGSDVTVDAEVLIWSEECQNIMSNEDFSEKLSASLLRMLKELFKRMKLNNMYDNNL